MRTMRYKYINWANKRGRCSSHKALIKCEFRHSVDIKGAWKYLTRHLRTIKRERVRKINIYLCESSAFLRVAVFLHINCRACRGTQTFGSYKYLTRSASAAMPKILRDRRTVGQSPIEFRCLEGLMSVLAQQRCMWPEPRVFDRSNGPPVHLQHRTKGLEETENP